MTALSSLLSLLMDYLVNIALGKLVGSVVWILDPSPDFSFCKLYGNEAAWNPFILKFSTGPDRELFVACFFVYQCIYIAYLLQTTIDTFAYGQYKTKKEKK